MGLKGNWDSDSYSYFVFLLVFLAALGVWIWHQIAVREYLWLTETQLSNIQSVIFSGAIGAVVSGYAQKHLNK